MVENPHRICVGLLSGHRRLLSINRAHCSCVRCTALFVPSGFPRMASPARKFHAVWVATGGSPVTAGGPYPGRALWLTAIRRYLLAAAAGNLVWETAQMPLYTLWHTASARAIAGAILHCSVADLIIAATGLIGALALTGSAKWPDQRRAPVTAAVVVGSVCYTIYSEYVNTVMKQSWAYTGWMPTLPWFGTGLSPLAQWLIIPAASLAWAGRATCNDSPKMHQHV